MRILVTITGEYEADPAHYQDEDPQAMAQFDFDADPAWFLCDLVENVNIHAVEDARVIEAEVGPA